MVLNKRILCGESWTARETHKSARKRSLRSRIAMKKVNVGLRGSAAGRGRDYEEKFVAKKPLSPSKDFKKEDTKEYKVSEPSTLHLARPSVASCGSSAQHNCANFDHEMVLMSSVEKAAEVSSQSRPSARGLNRQQHQASARERLARHGIIIHSVKLYTYVFFFHAVTN